MLNAPKGVKTALDKLEREYKDKFSLIFKSITVHGKEEVTKITTNRLENLSKRKLILKIFLTVILKKYKTGLIEIVRKLFNFKSANDIFHEKLNNLINNCNRF